MAGAEAAGLARAASAFKRLGPQPGAAGDSGQSEHFREAGSAGIGCPGLALAPTGGCTSSGSVAAHRGIHVRAVL